jgi:hypothetical protein
MSGARLLSSVLCPLSSVCWRWEEAAGPTEREKTLLNEAQAAYDANPSAGAPWSEADARLSIVQGVLPK